MGETGAVPGWSALITSVVMVGVLALLLRWAYGGPRLMVLSEDEASARRLLATS